MNIANYTRIRQPAILIGSAGSQSGNIPPMTVPLLTLTHMNKGVRFFHRNDELLFLEWLSRIPCVESCDGDGSRNGLVVRLKRRPGKDDLWQLLALCHRYGVACGNWQNSKPRGIETGFATPTSIGIGPSSGRRPNDRPAFWECGVVSGTR